MTSVWEHSEAAGTDLLVLLALADIADDNGECWPSIGHIARKCRIDSRTTQRRIRSLEKLGEVVVIPGGGKTSTAGGTRSNRYRIVVHMPVEEGGGDLPHHGTDARDGVAPVPGGGVAPVPPEPSVLTVSEPSLKPASPKSTKRRASQVPEDFAVTADMRQWCSAQGFRLDLAAETAKFIDHHRSKGNSFADPGLAWRNWMRNANKWTKPSGDNRVADFRSRSMQSIDHVLNSVPQPGHWDQPLDDPAITSGAQ